MKQQLLTAKQVAAQLSVSQQTITRNAIKRGIGRKIGIQWVFTASDISALSKAILENSERDWSAMGQAGSKSRWKPKRKGKKNE